MATAFSLAELETMKADAESRKPPDPSFKLYESARGVNSANSSVQNGLFVSTFARAEGEWVTYAFNPVAAWHLALMISQLMSLAAWTDECGQFLAPGASPTGFAGPTLQEKTIMRQMYERYLPPAPTQRELTTAPMVVAVSGGAGTWSAVLSFRLESNAIETLTMNQVVTYRLFAMLAATIESCHWIGSDGKLQAKPTI
jgi:hypothetical protein